MLNSEIFQNKILFSTRRYMHTHEICLLFWYTIKATKHREENHEN